jgi:hypothetical protein
MEMVPVVRIEPASYAESKQNEEAGGAGLNLAFCDHAKSVQNGETGIDVSPALSTTRP